MADTYLPADVRTRINDLIKNRKTTQKKVALAIGISESKFSRFLSDEHYNISEESIIRLARVFDVSTDFILGVTEIPIKNTTIFQNWDYPLKPLKTSTPVKSIPMW